MFLRCAMVLVVLAGVLAVSVAQADVFNMPPDGSNESSVRPRGRSEQSGGWHDRLWFGRLRLRDGQVRRDRGPIRPVPQRHGATRHLRVVQ